MSDERVNVEVELPAWLAALADENEIDLSEVLETELKRILDEDEEDYIPSSSNGDYGPGNPWDAPGMSIHDFI